MVMSLDADISNFDDVTRSILLEADMKLLDIQQINKYCIVSQSP